MPLGAQDEEPASSFHLLVRLVGRRIPAELNVDAAARHVGRNGNGTLFPRLRDYLSLAFVVLGVQDLMRYPLRLEVRGEQFVFLHRDGADENRLPLLVHFAHTLRDRAHLPLFALKYEIFVVFARGRSVGRDDDRVQSIYFVKFL